MNGAWKKNKDEKELVPQKMERVWRRAPKILDISVLCDVTRRDV